MEAMHEPSPVVQHPDLKLVRRLSALRRMLFLLAAVIAAGVLLAWLFPLMRPLLPPGWWLMQPDTALGMLLLIAACAQTQGHLSRRVKRSGKAAALLAVILALDAVAAGLGRPHLGWAAGLAVQPGGLVTPGMSLQTAFFFLLYGASLIPETTGSKARRRILDLLATLLVMSLLVVLATYAFDAVRLFGDRPHDHISPQTLVCMALLTFGLIVRRTRDGYYAVFVGIDVGSRVARLAMPFAVATPFLIVSLGVYLARMDWATPEYASALTAAVTATVLFTVVMLLARKINRLERDLLDMTLIDELTHLHNRRGFFMLGEHMLFEARRHHKRLTVLFFDLDGLKQVNDTQGHAAGSQMIVDFADLLHETFRSNDVLARLGGDEFAVAVLESDPRVPMKRLGVATAESNRIRKRPYRLSYSVGDAATAAPPGSETFNELVARADAVMYERKRRKKGLKEAQASA